MTNKLALWLLAIIVIALGLDYRLNDWSSVLFLSRKFADMIEWLAFWR